MFFFLPADWNSLWITPYVSLCILIDVFKFRGLPSPEEPAFKVMGEKTCYWIM